MDQKWSGNTKGQLKLTSADHFKMSQQNWTTPETIRRRYRGRLQRNSGRTRTSDLNTLSDDQKQATARRIVERELVIQQRSNQRMQQAIQVLNERHGPVQPSRASTEPIIRSYWSQVGSRLPVRRTNESWHSYTERLYRRYPLYKAFVLQYGKDKLIARLGQRATNETLRRLTDAQKESLLKASAYL